MSWQYPYPLLRQGIDFVIVWVSFPSTRHPVAVPQNRHAKREFERMQVNALAANTALDDFHPGHQAFDADVYVDGQPGPMTLGLVRYVAEFMVTDLAAANVGDPPWYNVVTNARYSSELDAVITMATYAATIAADFGFYSYRLREALRS